jgi:rubrerythrin
MDKETRGALAALRKGMDVERNGYIFYMQAAAGSKNQKGSGLFQELASDEVDHLKLFMGEYEALSAGEGWLPYEEAIARKADIDVSTVKLPALDLDLSEGIALPDVEIFSAEMARERAKTDLAGDLAILELAMKAERMSYELYEAALNNTTREAGQEAFRFLMEQENHHYELLQRTHEYLSHNETWWDDEELPFFMG